MRYLGVDVGRVRRLSIDKRDASRIVAIAEIDHEAPITSATRASLGLQGVTGLLFINLKEVPNIDKSVPLPQGERYPVIESIASDFDVFLSSLPELMGRANDLLDARRPRVLGREPEWAGGHGEEPARRNCRPAADVAEHREAGRRAARHGDGDRRARRSRCAASPRMRVRKSSMRSRA